MTEHDLVDLARHIRQCKQAVVGRRESGEAAPDMKDERHMPQAVAAQQQLP